MAQKFIDDFKLSTQYKSLLEETGKTELPITIDNLYKSYNFWTNDIVITLSKPSGINELINSDDIFANKYNGIFQDYNINKGKKIQLYILVLKMKKTKKQDYFSIIDYTSDFLVTPLNDKGRKYLQSTFALQNELFYSIWLNNIMLAIGANEIKEIVILSDTHNSEYFNFNTDKGEFISDNNQRITTLKYFVDLNLKSIKK